MRRYIPFAPYLVLLGGFALRLYRLGADSLWYDETVSLALARSDLAELIRHTAGDIHPPLYYLLLHGWGRLAGWSEFAAAFLSLWFGMLLIAVVYRVAHAWVGSATGAVLAAVWVALSPYNVWYSQEVRMYTVGATLGLLSVYYLRRMLSRERVVWNLTAYALVTAAGLYTLYYFLFLILFEWVWVMLSLLPILPGLAAPGKRTVLDFPSRWRSSIAIFLLSQLAVVVLYLPWLPIAFGQATDPPVPPWREFISLPRVILETFSALAFGQSVDPNVFGPVALLLLLPAGWLIWRELRGQNGTTRTTLPSPSVFGSPPPALFLLGYVLVPLGAIFVLSLWIPLYHVRYMFTYSPGFYLLAAYVPVQLGIALARARRPLRPLLSFAGVLLGLALLTSFAYSLNNFWYNDRYQPDDLRGAVNYIAGRWRPGDVILVNAGYTYPALLYYLPQPIADRMRLVDYHAFPSGTGPLVLQTGSIGGAPNLGWGDPRSDFYATTADETRAALDRVLANQPRVWILRLYDTVVDPNGIIREYFDQHATLLDDQPFGGESQVRVQGYLTQSPRELPAPATRVNQNLGDRVTLVGYQTTTSDVESGGFYDVVLFWQLRQSVNYNYQVTLQLLDAQGTNVAQTDEVPLGEILPMTRWQLDTLYREPLRLPIPSTLSPGEYHAIVKLYEPRSLEVLGEAVPLGTVKIH